LEKEVAKSDILKYENAPIGAYITEGASRPLIYEHRPEVRKEAIQQIVKKVEEKTMCGEKFKSCLWDSGGRCCLQAPGSLPPLEVNRIEFKTLSLMGWAIVHPTP